MERAPLTLLKAQPVAKGAKLLAAAKHYPCAHCSRDDGTIVAAHCNELALGRGMGFKTKDFQVAYLCMVCHDAHEGRSGGLTREERRVLWYRAHAVTMAWLFRDGRVVVA